MIRIIFKETKREDESRKRKTGWDISVGCQSTDVLEGGGKKRSEDRRKNDLGVVTADVRMLGWKD
jgi:hypothetical protein